MNGKLNSRALRSTLIALISVALLGVSFVAPVKAVAPPPPAKIYTGTNKLNGSNGTVTVDYATVDETTGTITAVAATGSRFIQWIGADAAASCGVVTVNPCVNVDVSSSAKYITAQFDKITTLTYDEINTNGGQGSIAITSPSKSALTADGTTGFVASDTAVLLTASGADGNSRFRTWGGAAATANSCTTAITCTISMASSTSISATFIDLNTLTYTITGSGSGSISSTEESLNASSSGSKKYESDDTSVTLTATPSAGSTFTGWSGTAATANSCTTATTCTISMAADTDITATFVQATVLTYDKTGSGSGTIAITNPVRTSLTNDATVGFLATDSSVTLTASAPVGSYFTGWSGDCSGTSTTCVVNMSSAKSVTANFNANDVLVHSGDSAILPYNHHPVLGSVLEVRFGNWTYSAGATYQVTVLVCTYYVDSWSTSEPVGCTKIYPTIKYNQRGKYATFKLTKGAIYNAALNKYIVARIDASTNRGEGHAYTYSTWQVRPVAPRR